MNAQQISDVKHTLKNQGRFYTDSDNQNWNDLVKKVFATKHPGWEDDMAYFRVTEEGRKALEETK